LTCITYIICNTPYSKLVSRMWSTATVRRLWSTLLLLVSKTEENWKNTWWHNTTNRWRMAILPTIHQNSSPTSQET